MSIPKYMSNKKPSGISVVISVEKLTQYIFKITSNEKQFPKAYRYTLSSALRNNCIDLCCHVYNGAYKRIVTTADYERVLKFQNAALQHLLNIKALMVISLGIVHINNPGYLAELYDEATDSFKRWSRNTRRAAKKAGRKEEIREMKRQEAELQTPLSETTIPRITGDDVKAALDKALAGVDRNKDPRPPIGFDPEMYDIDFPEDEVSADDSLRAIFDDRFRETALKQHYYGTSYDKEGFFVLKRRKTPFILPRELAVEFGMDDQEYNDYVASRMFDLKLSEDPTDNITVDMMERHPGIREACLSVPVNISTEDLRGIYREQMESVRTAKKSKIEQIRLHDEEGYIE